MEALTMPVDLTDDQPLPQLLDLGAGTDQWPERADPERTALVPCRERNRLQVHTAETWPADWALRYLEGAAVVYQGAAGVIVEVPLAAAAVLRERLFPRDHTEAAEGI